MRQNEPEHAILNHKFQNFLQKENPRFQFYN